MLHALSLSYKQKRGKAHIRTDRQNMTKSKYQNNVLLVSMDFFVRLNTSLND